MCGIQLHWTEDDTLMILRNAERVGKVTESQSSAALGWVT